MDSVSEVRVNGIRVVMSFPEPLEAREFKSTVYFSVFPFTFLDGLISESFVTSSESFSLASSLEQS